MKKDENDLCPKGLLLPFMTYSLAAINQPWIQWESHSLQREKEKEGAENTGTCQSETRFKLKESS